MRRFAARQVNSARKRRLTWARSCCSRLGPRRRRRPAGRAARNPRMIRRVPFASRGRASPPRCRGWICRVARQRAARVLPGSPAPGHAVRPRARPRRAEPVLREALELSRKQHGADSEQVGEAAFRLGSLLNSGDDKAAEPLLREAVEKLAKARPPLHSRYQSAVETLELLYEIRGDSAACGAAGSGSSEALGAERGPAKRGLRPTGDSSERNACQAI